MLRSCTTVSRALNCAPWRNRSLSTTCRLLQDGEKRKRGRPRRDDRMLNDAYAKIDAGKGNFEDVACSDSPDVGNFEPLALGPQVAIANGAFEASGDRPSPTKGRTTKAVKFPPRLIGTNSKHHDLSSYLRYATAAGQDVNSNVYRGTVYEYRVAETLKRYNFALERRGGRGDRGIDFAGFWRLEAQHHRRTARLPIILQCKALKPQPSMIRELEASFNGADAGWRVQDGAMALLAANGNSTKGVIEALQDSELPLGVMQITEQGILTQFLWNAAAAKLGLEGLGITLRYNAGQSIRADGQSIAFTWMGQPLRG